MIERNILMQIKSNQNILNFDENLGDYKEFLNKCYKEYLKNKDKTKNFENHLIDNILPTIYEKYKILKKSSNLLNNNYSSNNKENLICHIFEYFLKGKLDFFVSKIIKEDIEIKIKDKIILGQNQQLELLKNSIKKIQDRNKINANNKYQFVLSKLYTRHNYGVFNEKIFNYLTHKENFSIDDSKVDFGSFFDNDSMKNSEIKSKSMKFINTEFEKKKLFEKIKNQKIRENLLNTINEINLKYKLNILEEFTNDSESVIICFKLNSPIENNVLKLRINFSLEEFPVFLHDSNHFNQIKEQLSKNKNSLPNLKSFVDI